MIEVSSVNFTDKGKEPNFSRSVLHVRSSCFKNLAFPCRLYKRHNIDCIQTTKLMRVSPEICLQLFIKINRSTLLHQNVEGLY